MDLTKQLKDLQLVRHESHRDAVPLVMLKTQALTALIQSTKLARAAMGEWIVADGVSVEAVGAAEHVLGMIPGELGITSTVTVEVSAEDTDFAMVTVSHDTCTRYIVRRLSDADSEWVNPSPTWTLEMSATER